MQGTTLIGLLLEIVAWCCRRRRRAITNVAFCSNEFIMLIRFQSSTIPILFNILDSNSRMSRTFLLTIFDMKNRGASCQERPNQLFQGESKIQATVCTNLCSVSSQFIQSSVVRATNVFHMPHNPIWRDSCLAELSTQLLMLSQSWSSKVFQFLINMDTALRFWTSLPGAEAQQVPDNLLAYFNQIDCPDGWVHQEIPGRMLIDRGNYKGSREDGSQEAKIFVLGETGGEMQHKLTLSELPGHSHSASPAGSFFASQGSMSETWGLTAGGEYYGGVGRIGTTGTAGSNQQHNNLPPYFVATLCRKLNSTKSTDTGNLIVQGSVSAKTIKSQKICDLAGQMCLGISQMATQEDIAAMRVKIASVNGTASSSALTAQTVAASSLAITDDLKAQVAVLQDLCRNSSAFFLDHLQKDSFLKSPMNQSACFLTFEDIRFNVSYLKSKLAEDGGPGLSSDFKASLFLLEKKLLVLEDRIARSDATAIVCLTSSALSIFITCVVVFKSSRHDSKNEDMKLIPQGF